MRKRKFYLGQNKNPHNLGRDKSNGRKWVVPRMLREYFQLRWGCRYQNTVMKMNMNHAFVMMRTPYHDHADFDGSVDMSKPIEEGYLDDLPKLAQAAIDSPDASKALTPDEFYKKSLEHRKQCKKGYLGQLSIPEMRKLLASPK